MAEQRTRHRNVLDGTSFEFLKAGWWIWHAIAIWPIFSLGQLFWPR